MHKGEVYQTQFSHIFITLSFDADFFVLLSGCGRYTVSSTIKACLIYGGAVAVNVQKEVFSAVLEGSAMVLTSFLCQEPGGVVSALAGLRSVQHAP